MRAALIAASLSSLVKVAGRSAALGGDLLRERGDNGFERVAADVEAEVAGAVDEVGSVTVAHGDAGLVARVFGEVASTVAAASASTLAAPS